jgi:hypothetical protein
MRQRILAVAIGVLLSSPAWAAELEGVPLPQKVTAEGRSLTLSGAGIRYMLMFKVYVVTLHVERRASSAAALLADSAQVRRLTLTMLADLERKQVVHAFESVLKRQRGDTYPQWRERLAPFFDALRGAKKGERIVLTSVPGKGIGVVTPQEKLHVEGDDAAQVMLSIWLGDRPVDPKLREALVPPGRAENRRP